jgi:hypothetical protein
LYAEARGFGFTWSTDGLNWENATVIAVEGGTRTPLAAMLGEDGTLTVFYTSYSPGIWAASFSFEVKPASMPSQTYTV